MIDLFWIRLIKAIFILLESELTIWTKALLNISLHPPFPLQDLRGNIA